MNVHGGFAMNLYGGFAMNLHGGYHHLDDHVHQFPCIYCMAGVDQSCHNLQSMQNRTNMPTTCARSSTTFSA